MSITTRAIAPAILILSAATGAAAQNVITVNPSKTYQTMVAWEATAQAGQHDPAYPKFRDTLLDQVAEMGINRVRLQIRSGAEYNNDNFADYTAGRIDYATWRARRYATVNDNADPNSINWAGFQFSELDDTIDKIVTPLRQKVAARGGTLQVNLNYVAFTGQIGAGLGYDHDSPAEYAEFILATYLHIKQKYGWSPDFCEVILEPDNTSYWRGPQIGAAIAATAQKLIAHGFTPRFIAPSTMSTSASATYFDGIASTPGALQYIAELSYHRYVGANDSNLQAVGAKAKQYGVQTAMLEHIASGHKELYKDLTLAGNSSWQEYAIAYTNVADDGGNYFIVDTATNPSSPKVTMGSRTRYLRQYFKYVLRGAKRIEATSNVTRFVPVAFINPGNKQVVVVYSTASGNFSVKGLAAGTYGITYTTANDFGEALPDVTISAGGTLNATIPAAGVVTIYAKGSGSTPPPSVAPAPPTHVRVIP